MTVPMRSLGGPRSSGGRSLALPRPALVRAAIEAGR